MILLQIEQDLSDDLETKYVTFTKFSMSKNNYLSLFFKHVYLFIFLFSYFIKSCFIYL